ncbi:DUF3035 domain-containing protein [Litoreibacter roseus]|uniref:Beta-barrel assembly complex subunit BamF n=1 Tax=Litoreibacter roseus TaxID=2601869 RepID=A0A6N6JJK2_9RHOB|nr:DUF3035 domain-containing protein [Litoreibacter roseus]GFE66314.1 hypothetical protein KIN_33880 [Litoreibacter roseus]
MRTKMIMVLGVCALTMSACSGERDPRLLNVRSDGQGPDEFAVLPNKPLTLPDTYNALPEPTPGAANRADIDPIADATRALGGNPNGGISDGGLVAYASRYGTDPNIRTTLASEDLEFRRRNDGRLLERLFNVNVYYEAYSDQSLDQHAELDRLRRRGVRTVSAPPEGAAE